MAARAGHPHRSMTRHHRCPFFLPSAVPVFFIILSHLFFVDSFLSGTPSVCVRLSVCVSVCLCLYGALCYRQRRRSNNSRSSCANPDRWPFIDFKAADFDGPTPTIFESNQRGLTRPFFITLSILLFFHFFSYDCCCCTFFHHSMSM